MFSVRVVLALVVLMTAASAAWGQPVDPYQPTAPAPTTPTPTPANPTPANRAPTTPAAPSPSDAPQDPYAASAAGSDGQLSERISQALVARAQELLDARAYLDAKQLAVEALVKSPRGSSADRARAIIIAVNQQLGIQVESPRPRPEPPPVEDVDTTPIRDPTLPIEPVAPPPEGAPRRGRLAGVVHGGLYAGLLGSTIGAFITDEPAKGAVPLGIAAAAAGAFALPKLVDRVHWSEARVRTIGSVTVWGGMIGGLFGDIAKRDGSTARDVLVGASVGSTLAGLGGYAFTRTRKLTAGDVALIDTLAGIGAVGGFTTGMIMQPAETEAYSVNAVIGVTAGVVVGSFLGPQTNTTPRRMMRVAGAAALGGAAPFLLYAFIRDSGSTVDDRVTGLLSTAGLLGGGYLGLRFTRGMDPGLDTLDDKPAKEPDDAPLALIRRGSTGRWALGSMAIAPLSRALAPQHGMALQLLGGAF
jgi:hypothetical protein